MFLTINTILAIVVVLFIFFKMGIPKSWGEVFVLALGIAAPAFFLIIWLLVGFRGTYQLSFNFFQEITHAIDVVYKNKDCPSPIKTIISKLTPKKKTS